MSLQPQGTPMRHHTKRCGMKICCPLPSMNGFIPSGQRERSTSRLGSASIAGRPPPIQRGSLHSQSVGERGRGGRPAHTKGKSRPRTKIKARDSLRSSESLARVDRSRAASLSRWLYRFLPSTTAFSSPLPASLPPSSREEGGRRSERTGSDAPARPPRRQLGLWHAEVRRRRTRRGGASGPSCEALA